MAPFPRAHVLAALLILCACLVVGRALGLAAPTGTVGQTPAQALKTAILDPLSATVQASRSSADVGQAITFTCTATGGTPPYTFAWTLGDGSVATGSSVTHAYSSAGAMSVVCTVKDFVLGVASASVAVVISTDPSVSASVDHSTAAPGTVLTFTAQGSGGPGSFTYAWDFGDGTTGPGSPATHAYSIPGTFRAAVVATDGNGGTASSSVTLTIVAINVTAYESGTTGVVGTVFNFTVFAGGGAGPPYSYAWTFGDGASGTGASASHSYSAAGNYTPSVTATDSLGAKKAAQLGLITIVSSNWTIGGPLNVTLLITLTEPMVNQVVSLEGIGHGGSSTPTCSWSFGDSGTGTGCSVSHAWRTAGQFVVTVTVADSAGNHANSSRTLTVVPMLTASFVVSPSAPVVGQNVNLSAQPSGGTGGYSCTWDFGDSKAAVGCTVTHEWSIAGGYTVSLAIVDSQGHRMSVVAPVTVAPAFGLQGPIPTSGLILISGIPVAAAILAAAILIQRRRARPDGTPVAAGSTEPPAELEDYLADLERFADREPNRGGPPARTAQRHDGNGGAPRYPSPFMGSATAAGRGSLRDRVFGVWQRRKASKEKREFVRQLARQWTNNQPAQNETSSRFPFLRTKPPPGR